jgi:hypothetical protein
MVAPGPQRKGNISFDSHQKVASQSSYFGRNQSVVTLQVCTGVPDSSTGEVGGKVEGGVMESI